MTRPSTIRGLVAVVAYLLLAALVIDALLPGGGS